MARVLYFDCFNGASGDMVLGALLDAGLPLEELRMALGSLAIDGAAVSAKRVLRAGVSATKFIVQENGSHDDAHSHNGQAHAYNHDHEQGHGHSHSHDHAQGHEHTHAHSHEHGHAPAAVAHHHHPHRSLAEISRLIERSALSAAAQERAKALFRR